jgi:Zn-dependent protease
MMELSLVQKIAIWALPLLFAITVHEVAHGWVASLLGDQTARLSGRLTLNPLKHLDLFGTVLVPLLCLMTTGFVFGWAKPVPVDSRNLPHPRRDLALVAAGGPLSNFLMAFAWAGVAKLGSYLVGVHNVWLGTPLFSMGLAGIAINMFLCVLNFLPFPPLDGSKILYSLLPPRAVWHLRHLESYGFLILLFLWVTHLLNFILAPAYFLIQWTMSLFGLA